MFTGIIQAVGTVNAVLESSGDTRVVIDSGSLPMSEVGLGDSIAVNGVCLTVIERTSSGFAADVSAETLTCTTLSAARAGTVVNLELALTPTTRLGGHVVSGHVDGVGTVTSRHADARSWRLVITAPAALAKYIAAKGSICVDGVSLTVNHVSGAAFGVNIVPHTLSHTTLNNYAVGASVNLEVDLIARYLERLMLGERAAESTSGVTLKGLEQAGFIRDNP